MLKTRWPVESGHVVMLRGECHYDTNVNDDASPRTPSQPNHRSRCYAGNTQVRAKNSFMSESSESPESPLVFRTKIPFIHQSKRNLPHNGHCDALFPVPLFSVLHIRGWWSTNFSVVFVPIDRIARRIITTCNNSLHTILWIPHLAGSSQTQEQYTSTNERRLPTSCKPVSLDQHVSPQHGRPPHQFHGNCTTVCQLRMDQHRNRCPVEAETSTKAATNYDTGPSREAKQALQIEVKGQEGFHIRQEEPKNGLHHLLS